MAILLLVRGRVKDPPHGLMVFLGMLPEVLLEVYNAANSWNPTNERKLILRIAECIGPPSVGSDAFNFGMTATFRHMRTPVDSFPVCQEWCNTEGQASWRIAIPGLAGRARLRISRSPGPSLQSRSSAAHIFRLHPGGHSAGRCVMRKPISSSRRKGPKPLPEPPASVWSTPLSLSAVPIQGVEKYPPVSVGSSPRPQFLAFLIRRKKGPRLSRLQCCSALPRVAEEAAPFVQTRFPDLSFRLLAGLAVAEQALKQQRSAVRERIAKRSGAAGPETSRALIRRSEAASSAVLGRSLTRSQNK